ncbi:MAG: S41 family peptidase [Blastocatellales bacterium]
MKNLRSLSVILLLMVLTASVCPGQAPQPSPVNRESSAGSPAINEVWRETFDICWTKVKDTHFDPTFGGVDWDGVRRKYEPRLGKISSDAELHRMLQEMLNELGQSHFSIIAPEAIVADHLSADPSGGIGIDLRVIGDRVVISRVEPGSAAAKAGLRTGFIVQSVGDVDTAKLWQRLEGSGESVERRQMYLVRRLMAELSGAPGSSVRIAWLDSADRTAEKSVIREKMSGELSPPMGNFPPQYTEFHSERLPGDIGYIRFNIFTTPVMQKVRDAVGAFSSSADGRPVKGIIFDLRGNPGGIGGMASGIAGMLTSSQGSLGTMKFRKNELKFAYFPQQNAFTGPVAVIIDGFSASTSEILAGGLQEIGRAVVLGEKSMGAALPSYFQKLPTGAMLQYAIADFRTPRGVLIEGRGVVPDRPVPLDRKSLIEGRDPQLDAAVKYVNDSSVREK